jgi:hypothetical protein
VKARLQAEQEAQEDAVLDEVRTAVPDPRLRQRPGDYSRLFKIDPKLWE